MGITYETKWRGIHAWKRSRANSMHIHAHDYCEILYARGGDWTVNLNFKEYKLQKGDIFFAFPGQLHSHKSANIENFVLLFPKNLPLYDGILENYLPSTPVLHGVIDEELDELFLKAVMANRIDSPYTKGIICGYISLILGKLLPLFELSPASKDALSKEEKLIRYCSEHYKEPLTLSSVAKELGYSPTHLSHLFKDKFQITFTKFITLMRIEDAKKMLRGNKNITDIAFDCGFGSMRSFNHIFKAETSITPSEYRKRNKK